MLKATQLKGWSYLNLKGEMPRGVLNPRIKRKLTREATTEKNTSLLLPFQEDSPYAERPILSAENRLTAS